MPQLLTVNAPITINGLQVTIEAAAKFAPVVRFHPKEQYFPCSIEFLLSGSTLVVGSTEKLQPTFDDLYAARNADDAHLRIDPSAWPGMAPQNNVIPAPMYVAPQVAPDRSFVDFTYYFLSAFNGPQAAWVHVKGNLPLTSFDCAIEQFAYHQGDVESITVRVTPDFSKLWWTTFDTNAGSWVKDREFGHGIATPAGAAIAALNGVLYCVHRGNDNGLWWTQFDGATSTWAPDRSFGHGEKTSSAPALAVLKGTLYCAYRGMDNQLWWTLFKPSLSAWGTSQAFGQGTTASAAPSLAAYNGDLYCTYKGTGSQHLWWTMFDPTVGTWSSSHQFNFDIRSQDAPAVLSVV